MMGNVKVVISMTVKQFENLKSGWMANFPWEWERYEKPEPELEGGEKIARCCGCDLGCDNSCAREAELG